MLVLPTYKRRRAPDMRARAVDKCCGLVGQCTYIKSIRDTTNYQPRNEANEFRYTSALLKQAKTKRIKGYSKKKYFFPFVHILQGVEKLCFSQFTATPPPPTSL